MKVLFIHGYGSSPETSKFKVIEADVGKRNKHCIQLHYDEWSHDKVGEILTQEMRRGRYDVVAGHSLGGYWAVKMGEKFGVSTVLMNPQLFPKFEGYDQFDEIPMGFPVYAYFELGDEILEVQRTVDALTKRGLLVLNDGGHHRLDKPERINDFLNMIHNNSTNYI